MAIFQSRYTLYKYGDDNVPRDKKESVKMFGLGITDSYAHRRHCCGGSPYFTNGSQNELALMYRNGELKNTLVSDTLSSYPYGYTTNFTGKNVQCAMLDTNIPYPMAVGINNGIHGIFQYRNPQEAFAAGAADGQRTVLVTEFSKLQSGVQALIAGLENLAKTQGITAAQKAEIARLIGIANKILAALEKIQNNRNEQVSIALQEVEALKGSFAELKGQAEELATKIANGNTNPTTPTTPTSDTPIVDVSGDNVIPEATGETLEEIQNQFKTELAPIINQVLTECKDTMTAQERQTVVNKVNELKQAIKDKKEVEEVKKIYNEIVALVGQHMENAPFITAYKEAGIGEAIKEIMEPDNKEVSAADKAAVKRAKAKYDAEMKKPNNATGKQDALEALYEAIRKIDEKSAAKAGKICSKIYELANGVDWTSSQESELKNTIKSKINKYNVIDILDQWANGGYISATGDNNGLMETVFGEFKAQPSVKKELAEHMLQQLEAVAKKRKVNISAEAGIIRGEIKNTSLFSVWNYSAIYNAFNSIHAKLGNPLTDVDKQAAAVKQEAAEQQTPADEQAARKAA